LFTGQATPPETIELKEAFLNSYHAHGRSGGSGYIEAIKSLPDHTARKGTEWLQQIVSDVCRQAAALLPSLKLFRK
jgi:hypothetical protein